MRSPAMTAIPGRLYLLADIQHLTLHFKTKTFLRAKDGVFHLYLNSSDYGYWIGGPFKGRDSSLFLFLGFPKSEEELKKIISAIRAKNDSENQSDSSEAPTDPFLYPAPDFGILDVGTGFGDFLSHVGDYGDWGGGDFGDGW